MPRDASATNLSDKLEILVYEIVMPTIINQRNGEIQSPKNIEMPTLNVALRNMKDNYNQLSGNSFPTGVCHLTFFCWGSHFDLYGGSRSQTNKFLPATETFLQ